MTKFIEALNPLFKYLYGDEGSTTNNTNATDACEHQLVNDHLFYQLCLVPATLIVLALCCTQKRRHLFLDKLRGRPGIIYPLEIAEKYNRISYACAFGSTVYLILSVVFDDFRAIEFEGPLVWKTVIILLSVLIFGMVYLPVFLCLTVTSLYGYVFGTAYTWMLTTIEFIRLFQCQVEEKVQWTLVVSRIPQLLCLLYLNAIFLINTILSIKRQEFGAGKIEKPIKVSTMADIRQSVEGKRVIKLLTPNTLKHNKGEESTTKWKRFLNFVQDHTYRYEPDFKYSASIISTLVVSFMVLYTIACQVFVLFFGLLKALKKFSEVLLQTEGLKEGLGQVDIDETIREAYQTVDYFIGPLISAVVIASLLGAYNILRTLVGYRETMHRLNKGELKEYTQGTSNQSLLVCCMRYSGYQVAYIAWGFVIHGFVFWLLSTMMSFMVYLLINGYTEWLTDGLLQLWPLPMWVIIINVSQSLAAKFLFLQDKGQYLAFDNRRALFLFNYFMFFYNIFLGLFSTLMRIFKGLVIGTIMLPRLDKSTLPIDFAGMDPGYSAYVGFMKVECSQSHPVMITFIRLLQLLSRKSPQSTSVCDQNENPKDASKQDQLDKRRAMRFNWYLAYTLINNPDLRMERKGYVQSVRKARELGILIPKSDGFVQIDPELLKQVELENQQPEILSRAKDLKSLVVKKVRVGIAHLRDKKDSEKIMNGIDEKGAKNIGENLRVRYSKDNLEMVVIVDKSTLV